MSISFSSSCLDLVMLLKRRSVAVLVETSNAYGRGVMAGILRYARQHNDWSLYLPEQERGAPPPAWLDQWRGDGFLARIETPEIAAMIRRTGLPAVDLSAARLIPGIPWVETDDAAIARLAFEHLRERGYQQFAYCGAPHFNWSNLRRDAFVQLTAAGGYPCSVFESHSRLNPDYSWEREHTRMTTWLGSLPHPTGVFVCYDFLAQRLIDTCRDLDLAIPEQLAVISVDNDELICNAAAPSLTSVIPDAERAGYEAAQILAGIFAGQPSIPEGVFIAPLGIENRQSSDLFAVDDPMVAKALRLIRERACQGAKVQDILEEIPQSRRILESRFKKVTGKTPHDFLLRYRLERAQALLRETNLPMLDIAERSGFVHAEYMSEVFIREIGQRPGEFRRHSRDE